MRFANDFHSWLHHSWKLLANRLTRDPKIVIYGNSCIILFIYHAGIMLDKLHQYMAADALATGSVRWSAAMILAI